MKNTDYSFKLVAAVILAGVVVAFASPGHAPKSSPAAVAADPAIVHTTSADANPAAATE